MVQRATDTYRAMVVSCEVVLIMAFFPIFVKSLLHKIGGQFCRRVVLFFVCHPHKD